MGYSGQRRPPWDKELNEDAKGVTVQESGRTEGASRCTGPELGLCLASLRDVQETTTTAVG